MQSAVSFQAELIVAPHVLHLLIVQPPANFLLMSQFPPEMALVRLTLTLSTTPVPFPSSSPSPRHSVTQPQPSQIVAHPHESLASQSLQQGLSRLSPWPHPHLHDPSLSDSYPLSRSNIFPPTKSLTGKQLVAPRLFERLARDALETARKKGHDHAWSHRRCSHPLDGRRPHWQCRY